MEISEPRRFQKGIWVRLYINREQHATRLYPISSEPQDDQNSDFFHFKIEKILEIASSVLRKEKITINKFMNVFVEIENKLFNIFKLKQQSLDSKDFCINLKRKNYEQDQGFVLNVWVIDIEKNEKANPLLELTVLEKKYEHVMKSLQKISQSFTYEFKNLNEQQKSTYDIAYLIAEPLVQPSNISEFKKFPSKASIYQNLKLETYISANADVSFQKQYDKFIAVIKDDTFFRNIKIQLMVATQNNIRQVLTERCNILHFACHGELPYLQIEKDRDVGYLDAMTADRLIKLLNGKVLPKIIIFNACHSYQIAQKIHLQFPSITTIGYEGKANDVYCQILTERIYEGIYKSRKQFFKLFEEVKKQITSKSEGEGKKLHIYKSKEQPKFDYQIANKQGYNIDWVYLKNLGVEEPIGIKEQLYEFIKNYLLNREKTKIFVVGEPRSGKSIFIKKALYYTMHRCQFRQNLEIDCRSGEKPIMSMLQFKLKHKKNLEGFIKENKLSNIIIIIDHCEDLIQNDPEEFMKFFKNLQKKVKFGKIVLITDNASYYTQINIMMDENVYQHQETVLEKCTQQYKTFMNRWKPKLEKNYDLFNKSKAKIWFKAVRMTEIKQDFINNLQQIQRKEKEKQDEKLLVDLKSEFDFFKDKIINAQRKIKAYFTSGYFSRNQDCFILLNTFPQFSKNRQTQDDSTTLRLMEKYQKFQHLNDLASCYEEDIKDLIPKLIKALGRYHTQDYDLIWWENQLLFITQKLLLIVGLASLLKDPKQTGKQVEDQLFNSYTFIVKLFNRYQKKLSQLPKVVSHCEVIKLKICMGLYNLYKQEYYANNLKELEFLNQQRNNQNTSNQKEVQSSFLRSLPEAEMMGGSNDYNSNNESALRDSINQRYIQNPLAGSSVRSQMGNSEMPDFVNRTLKSKIKDQTAKKQSLFADFEVQMREQYHRNQYWQLIQKVKQIDTMIRMIQFEEERSIQTQLVSLNPFSPAFDMSPIKSHKNFEVCYKNIHRFYHLYEHIEAIYERLSNSTFASEESYVQTYKIQKVFFSKIELQLAYLQGLKLIKKFFSIIGDEYLFEFQAWYNETFKYIRLKLQKTERILEDTIANKITQDRDLSYKIIYREYLQLYIDMRFKLQKYCSSFIVNGEKQSLKVFNQLMKLSDQVKSLKLKNKIEKYLDQTYYNKCSILFSEPIGYFPKRIKKSFIPTKLSGKQKNNNKQKKTPKKLGQDSDQDQDRKFFRCVNISRSSDLVLNLMKNETEKKVLSQIHIQTQLLNYERLKTYSSQDQEDKKKKRLIYLIICDYKSGKHNDSVFLENEYGESIKYEMNKLLSNQNIVFPYAPVIILYGSNPTVLRSYYKQFSQDNKKKIAIITLKTCDKLPEINDSFKETIAQVWNEYLQKQIGLAFLANFWIKFCQIYFDEEHQSFRNQVIRSFNIAKQQSIILLKKKHLEGISSNEIQQAINSIQQNLTLYYDLGSQSDSPVNLENNLKNGQSMEHECSQTFYQSRHDEQIKGSRIQQNSVVRRENQILQLYNHEIGCNEQIYKFLKKFQKNVDNYQDDKPYWKNWIEYCPQISETGLNSFVNTVYHKLLRMGNRFQLGVELINMETYKKQQDNDYLHAFEINSVSSNQMISISRGISSETNTLIRKQKKVQIYDKVPQQELKSLIESFTKKDESMTGMDFSCRQNLNSPHAGIFRIVIVESKYIDEEMRFYLQSLHSCKVNRYEEKSSYLQNLYHACDTIFHYSQRIENFSFMKTMRMIFPKDQDQNQLKYMSSRQVKQKIIQYIDRHH